MELHNLKPTDNSRKSRRRVGRGPGSGLGKTSGRGHKGAGQRSGYTRRLGHEGGQMPLQRRLPKRGFHNIFKTEFQIINVADLARIEPGEVSPEILLSSGLIKKKNVSVKILGNGEIDKAYNVKADAFSSSARKKIEAAGGKAELIA